MIKIPRQVLQFSGLFLLLMLFSCGEEEATPKPRGYFRIQLPDHQYTLFDPPGCPFRFEIPSKAVAIADTMRKDENCWWFILLPEINGQIYLTYKPITNDLPRYLEDTHTLVYKHTSRASSINEQVMSIDRNVGGVFYTLGGDAASSTQFFLTDSLHHFVRGALYFNAVPNTDSLAPLVQYAREDVLHLMQSFRWK